MMWHISLLIRMQEYKDIMHNSLVLGVAECLLVYVACSNGSFNYKMWLKTGGNYYVE